mgnify:CR=1 FL=1
MPPRSPVAPEAFYTILVRDFATTVFLAGESAQGAGPQEPLAVTVCLEMQVRHPGPEFADDIASVMSYEGVIEGLRALATTGPFATLTAVAEQVACLALADPRVDESWMRVAPVGSGGIPDAVELRRGRPCC